MKLRNTLLAASLLALPVAAHAQPINGLYIGGGVGGNYLAPVNNNTGANLNSSGGPVVVGSVGWGLGNGLRFELEGNWRYTHAHIGNGGLQNGNLGGGANLNAFGVMANGLYDFNLGWIMPYVGAGIGYQWTEIQNGNIYTVGVPAPRATSLKVSNSTQGAFAAQGILGAAFPLAPGLALTAEYRFLAAVQDEKFGGTVTAGGVTRATTVKLKNQYNNAGLIGVRYAFNQPPVIAPAPAPVAAPAPAPARTYLVFFDWDKADLTARARQIIAEAAQASTRVAVTRIEVSGHADLSGTAAYNMVLSRRRADNVAAELVRDGVPQASISVMAYGDTRPAVPTAPGVREVRNRRVEIVLK